MINYLLQLHAVFHLPLWNLVQLDQIYLSLLFILSNLLFLRFFCYLCSHDTLLKERAFYIECSNAEQNGHFVLSKLMIASFKYFYSIFYQLKMNSTQIYINDHLRVLCLNTFLRIALLQCMCYLYVKQCYICYLC